VKPLLTALLLAATLPAVAAEEDQFQPHTLTPKEVADGWLSLFAGETTFGWTVPGGGEWVVADGLLARAPGTSAPLVTASAFGSFELRLQYLSRKDSDARLVLRCDAEGKVEYAARLRLLHLSEGWHELTVRVVDHPTAPGDRPSSAQVTMRGLRGTRSESLDVESWVPRGHIALAGGGVVFRGIKLRPIGFAPAFSGKELAGWREVRNARSRARFTVTAEGWLRVQGGPGELQSRTQYDDFILRLDCRTNSDRVAGGVHIRCLPAAVWPEEVGSGYEAHIHNQWTGGDRARPVNYGTGGLYALQAARRVVASDREWFTLTVLAHGRHLAVWVNGYQTADYCDPHPFNKDARSGSTTDRGPVALAGSDATTDLSLRNIRIAELPRAEYTSP
jgi:hypothetical protein